MISKELRTKLSRILEPRRNDTSPGPEVMNGTLNTSEFEYLKFTISKLPREFCVKEMINHGKIDYSAT